MEVLLWETTHTLPGWGDEGLGSLRNLEQSQASGGVG